jgi:hypothetical protein
MARGYALPVRFARVLVVATLATALAGCGGSDGAPTTGGSAAGGLIELKSVDTLKAAFAEGQGKPRLLLLLSPT